MIDGLKVQMSTEELATRLAERILCDVDGGAATSVLPDTAYFSIGPDWICEVQSPSTAALDRAKKLRVYAHEGVGYAWMVDPEARTLEILRL